MRRRRIRRIFKGRVPMKRTGNCWRCQARVWIRTGFVCLDCLLRHHAPRPWFREYEKRTAE